MPTASSNVRFQGQLGKHLLALSFSQFDPNETFPGPEALHPAFPDLEDSMLAA